MEYPVSFSHNELVHQIEVNFSKDRNRSSDTENFLNLTTMSLQSKEKAQKILQLLFNDLVVENVSTKKINETKSELTIGLQGKRTIKISCAKIAKIKNPLRIIIEKGRVHLKTGSLSVLKPTCLNKIFFKIASMLLKNRIELDLQPGDQLDLDLSEKQGLLKLKIGNRYDKPLTDERFEQLIKQWSSWAEVAKNP